MERNHHKRLTHQQGRGGIMICSGIGGIMVSPSRLSDGTNISADVPHKAPGILAKKSKTITFMYL